MKLPYGHRAELGDKLDRYCLNMQHKLGRHKAIKFKNKLGITIENKLVLEEMILRAANESEAEIYKTDRHGIHYDVIFEMETEVGFSRVLSCWIVKGGEDFPRLTTTYPIE